MGCYEIQDFLYNKNITIQRKKNCKPSINGGQHSCKETVKYNKIGHYLFSIILKPSSQIFWAYLSICSNSSNGKIIPELIRFVFVGTVSYLNSIDNVMYLVK